MKKVLRKTLGLIRLPRMYDLPLLFYCVVLSLIGVVFIGSATITSDETVVHDVMSSVIKQLIFLGISLFMMMIVSNIYSDKLAKKLLIPIVLGVFGLLMLCLLMPSQYNAKGWIILPLPGPTVSIQPSEFAKAAMVLLIAYTMCNRPKTATFWDLVKVPAFACIVYVLVIWRLQNDFGSAAVIFMVTFLTMMIPYHRNLKKGHRILFGAMVFVLLLLLYLMSPAGEGLLSKIPMEEYQKWRFRNVSNPFGDFYETGYQVGNSLIAFSRGGLTGVGLGKSVQKFGYLPKAYNDFIFAVVAEEGGFLVAGIVLLLFAGVIKRLLQYTFRAQRQEHKVILFGTCAYLFVHILLNIGGASAFIPLTGVPLLMLSQGGTSLMTWYMMLGVSEHIIATIRRGEEEGVVYSE
ncbi:MAG: FtsW/RodA/SpoVE family cell cycle protein [Erysipelotrichales bacterium]|nr:FtsW/RodA/SpoVE family cell cycle protein [Erysipelotrichales bacterium]